MAAINSGPALVCPTDKPQHVTLIGDSNVDSQAIVLAEAGRPVNGRASNISRTTYLTIYGQRRREPGDADYTYDVVDCIDSATSVRWQQLQTKDMSGQPYLAFRLKMWDPLHVALPLEIERHDGHDGHAGSTQRITINCPSDSTNIDELLNLQVRPQTPSGSGAGSATGIDGGAP